MKTNAKNNILWENVSRITGIMIGSYDGIWSGYQVKFEANQNQYMFEVVDGIRGISPCKVEILENCEIQVTL
jgi:hypothetical protein